jgi:hypothetical protein
MREFKQVKPKAESETLIKQIAEARSIDEDIIREVMAYNVVTPLQLCLLTGFSRNKVEMMLMNAPLPKLTVVYPFSSFFHGAGPKFIYKNRKFYELIKYLLWESKRLSRG